MSRRDVRRVSVSVFLFETSSLQSSNRCAQLQESDRTLRDGSFGWRFPGTSCQATIAPSLRDAFSPAPLGHNPKSLSAFVERSDLLILTSLENVPEGQSIVAWHEVPGKSVPRKNRPVGYGMIG